MVHLIFRCPNNRSFSIEKVFNTVYPFLQQLGPVERHFAPSRAASPLAILQNLLALRKLNAAVYHITGDIHYAVFAFPASRTILTIHDCVFMYGNKGIRKWLFSRLWLKWPVRRAHLITTISEKSKAEIIQFTGCDPSRIIVVPNPVGEKFTGHPKAFEAGRPRILFIGTKSNKNLERTIEALAGISCVLTIIGPLAESQLQLLKKHRIDFENFSGLSEDELVRQYQEADMLLFPSLYEGFGLPVLEAQRVGRVVVTSHLSPMKEVAGNGACFVDPYNTQSIRQGVKKVIDHETYRRSLIEEGHANVAQYEPGRVAGQYNKIYQHLLLSIEGNPRMNH